MYFTDRGLDELEGARGDEQVVLSWLVERMREFIDLHPEHEAAIDRLASWLARVDEESEDPDEA
jgi:hypothetical protein